MRHLVIIGYVWPEPNSSAAGYHMLSLIHAFQSWGWHVTFASPATVGEHRFALQSIGVDEISIALNCSSFDAWIQSQAPDAVLFDRFMMEEQFGWRVAKQCPHALRILDLEDLHSLRETRQQLLKTQLRHGQLDFDALMDPHYCYPLMSEADITQREVAAIYRTDISLVISDTEKHLLETQFRVSPHLLVHCPFMQPPALSNTPEFTQRQHFVTVGNFRHAPNWDSVRWLKETIWPMIRQQLPEAQLHIYGAYPPKKAMQLHHDKTGFLIKGWADDAYRVIADSKVLLAPLRFGAGIKGKLLDAMRTGTPSVTTPIGAEGMLAANQWPGKVCTSAEAMATAAVALYTNAHQWSHAQAAGYHALDQHFNANRIRTRLYHAVHTLLDEAPLREHRQQNFTGQMLRHHQHRSTQFMSQWIEAKQRLQDASTSKPSPNTNADQ